MNSIMLLSIVQTSYAKPPFTDTNTKLTTIKFVGFSTGTTTASSSLVVKNEICRQSFPNTGKARMSKTEDIVKAIDDNEYIQLKFPNYFRRDV